MASRDLRDAAREDSDGIAIYFDDTALLASLLVVFLSAARDIFSAYS